LKRLLILAALVCSAACVFPALASASSGSGICYDGILSNDAGQGCTNDAAYGGAPAASTSSSGWSDGAICHDGILSDDAGQNCADGLYAKVYGSGGSSSSSSSSTPVASTADVCHDGILSDDAGHGCGGTISSTSSSTSTSSYSSSGSYSDVPGVPSSFAACVAYRESTNGTASSNVYGIIADPRGDGSLAEQKQAFSELYASRGTQPWAPYDGC
jgi:hypothetical protein